MAIECPYGAATGLVGPTIEISHTIENRLKYRVYIETDKIGQLHIVTI